MPRRSIPSFRSKDETEQPQNEEPQCRDANYEFLAGHNRFSTGSGSVLPQQGGPSNVSFLAAGNHHLPQNMTSNVNFLAGNTHAPALRSPKPQAAHPPRRRWVNNHAAANSFFLSSLPIPRLPSPQVPIENTKSTSHAVLAHEPTVDIRSLSDQIVTSLYTSLDSSEKTIRLLRIDAGSNDTFSTALRYTLSVVQPWKRSVSYECLSYCWGDTHNYSNILVRTAGSEYQAVAVTANLYNALLRLQDTHTSRYLWIDFL
jgi:hypothetical protein